MQQSKNYTNSSVNPALSNRYFWRMYVNRMSTSLVKRVWELLFILNLMTAFLLMQENEKDEWNIPSTQRLLKVMKKINESR